MLIILVRLCEKVKYLRLRVDRVSGLCEIFRELTLHFLQ